jgi:hypothetical protein
MPPPPPPPPPPISMRVAQPADGGADGGGGGGGGGAVQRGGGGSEGDADSVVGYGELDGEEGDHFEVGEDDFEVQQQQRQRRQQGLAGRAIGGRQKRLSIASESALKKLERFQAQLLQMENEVGRASERRAASGERRQARGDGDGVYGCWWGRAGNRTGSCAVIGRAVPTRPHHCPAGRISFGRWQSHTCSQMALACF